jgi:hypothetical protein
MKMNLGSGDLSATDLVRSIWLLTILIFKYLPQRKITTDVWIFTNCKCAISGIFGDLLMPKKEI